MLYYIITTSILLSYITKKNLDGSDIIMYELLLVINLSMILVTFPCILLN